ncbi:MAG: hypothetical protein M3415_07030 [Actinomycetota bacterium]|jgi:hypothetical protein|nr:hypothetical protein [Actinomycetota bacterium]
MYLAQVDVGQSVQGALSAVLDFVPKLVGFLLILLIGYFVAKAIASVLDKVLDRVGFDRAVERGGVKKALSRSSYDASGLLSKIVFYALMLFVLQLAFGVFPANPISDLITAVIAYLPKIFVAIIIIVVAAAIAAAVREIVDASLGGLSYGKMLGNIASVFILAVGVFAALNQLEIAEPIVNGLFYALLAIFAGSAIIAIGGGGITPMRSKWEQALNKVEQEAPAIKQQAADTSSQDLKARADQRKQQAQTAGSSDSGRGTTTSGSSAGSVASHGDPTINLPNDETTPRR